MPDMSQAELNRLCQQSGGEGALWRLVRSWDPDKVAQWALIEKRNIGLSPDQALACVAEVIAGACFSFGHTLGGDRKEAILGTRGLLAMVRQSVAHKLDQVGGAHQIIRPGNDWKKINGG